MPANDCAIIILAAGNSSRLGTPKQLLKFENKTLLQRAIDEATSSGIGSVVVVTGANKDMLNAAAINATFIYNDKWQQGMAGSLHTGLSSLLSIQPDLASVIIMLCDQPFVSSSLLMDLREKRNITGKGIIACKYGKTIGVPVLFSSNYFEDLLSLQGTEGAKNIILKYNDDVDSVSFPLGSIDIDTREDYERLLK